MLRTLLIGILAVSAAASCTGGKDAPAARPGVSAGKVIELTGTVTATRGTDVRTLTPGGEISADDVIGTAADSRVVILVAHNNARWDLGPNKHAKVGDSLAWTAAKQDLPAVAVTEETSTAGRHAEKTAATTETTTAEAKSAPHNESAAVAPGSTPPPPAQAPVPTAASVPPPPPPTTASDEARQDDKPIAPDPAVVMPAEREKQQKSAGADKDMADEADGDLGMLPPRTGARPKSPKPALRAEPDPGAPLSLEVRRTIVKERDAMRGCLETPTLIVAIGVVNGRYTITTADAAASAKTRTCLAKIAKRLKATKSTEPVTVKINLAK